MTIKDNAPQDAGLPNYSYGSGIDRTLGGLEVMAKDYNGQFYIFADTRDSETRTNIPATFTIADPNATSVTVVGENRTIPVVNGVFNDTFATAATVHIYQVNDGPSGPTISSIVESPASGHLNTGSTVSLTLDFSSAVTVAGGTPTLTLNDGGAATYVSGSGSNALTFSYTVAAGQNAASLAATAVNLNSATIKDGAGNAANLSLSGLTQTGPQIGTVTPTISSIADSPSSGDLGAGKVVTLTLNLNEAVTVTGTPQLMLNDGGIATYTAGSGTSALTFKYTVLAGQNTPDLQVTTVNLNGGTISDGAGNATNLSLAGIAQGSPAIDTTTPAAPVISGDTVNGNTVTLTGTAEANSAITVFDNATQLGTATTNSSGAWTYTTGALANGSQSFTATATDGAGNVSPLSSALAMTLTAPVNLVANGSFETNSFTGWTLGGNDAPLAVGPQIYVNKSAESGTSAAAMGSVGSDGTLSQTMATTAGQQYTLSFWLQNGASGTNDFTALWNGQKLLALTNAAQSGYTEYTYTVTATGSTSTLQFAARNDPSHWNLDNISLTPAGTTTPTDTTAPLISSIAETPSSGVLNAGKTVTYTITTSEAVTVTGTPQLMLNDGGIATYTAGSGTSALTFKYTVLAGQNTPDLQATAVNLNGGTISDGAGNAANLSLAGIAQGSPAIDTTTPAAPVISGDTVSGNTVTLTGTAEANSAITVFDNATQLGTATTNSSGAWTYTTGALANGSQSFTATATDGAGNVSPLSSALAMTLTAPVNLVANGSFETNSFTGWTLGGNDAPLAVGPQIYVNKSAESGTSAAAMGSVGSDGTLSQTLQTTAGEQYTLSFWLANNGSGPNDFTAKWNGTTVLALTNAPSQNYTEYTFTVTATGGTSTLEFDARQDPSHWSLDNVLLTAASTTTPTLTPTVSSLTESPSSGDLNAGNTVTLTLTMSEAVTVNTTGGSPTLALNDSGTATYSGGSGSSALTFTYTVAAGQNTASLAATAVNLNGATIKDGSGNAANLSLGGLTQIGPQIGTVTPTISSIAESPSSGVLNAGKVVTLTLAMNEAVTVTGTPQLMLNDGGIATYTAGSGTSALTFKYTVLAGQNTPDLQVTAVNLNGGRISDGAGNAANLSLTGIAQGSPAIDTTAPAAPAITGDTLDINKVTLTGTAEANTTVTVYDNSNKLGTTTANANGDWNYTTGALSSGAQDFTATATDAAGNTSASSDVLDPVIPKVVNLSGNRAIIPNNTILEVNGPTSKGSVTFTGTTGALVLNQPQTFRDLVSGFRAETEIDLPGMAFNAQSTLAYSRNNSISGTLSVTNGTQSAQIALLGSYMASSFVLEADNNGGTLVVTPTSQNGQSIVAGHSAALVSVERSTPWFEP